MLSLTLLKRKINNALVWSLIEAFGYKTIYIILHIFLYKNFSSQMYAFQASLFGLLYMTVTVLNQGFDQSLLYHFNKFAFSQKGIKNFLKIFLYHSLITFVCISFLGFFAYYYNTLFFFDIPSCSFLCIFAFLLFIEIIKKNIKIILYLSFYNTVITIAEISALGFYTYYLFHTKSLFLNLFTYLTYINSIIVLFFMGCLYHYYKTISPNIAQKSFVYNISLQYQSYFLQLIKMLTSSQFLMPIYILKNTYSESAHFFLIATILQSGEFILYKICHVSGSTFFAYDTHESTFLSNNMLSILLKKLFPFYTAVIAISFLPLYLLLPFTPTTLYFTFIYSTTLLIDNLLLLYEKYSISYNKLYTYTFSYSLLCITTWTTLKITRSNHLFYATTLFLVGKFFLASFICYKEKISNKHKG